MSQAISSVTGHPGHPGHSGEDLGHHRRTLARQQHTLGDDHLDTLATRFGIARELAARGDHAGAEEEFRAVLAVRQRKLGPEHPQTLIARFSMAQQLAARGDRARAEKEFRYMLPHLLSRASPYGQEK